MENGEWERNEECEPVTSLANYLASALGPGSGNVFMAPFWNKSSCTQSSSDDTAACAFRNIYFTCPHEKPT